MKVAGYYATGVSLLTLVTFISLNGNASASTARAAATLPPRGNVSPKSGTWKDVNGPILPANPDVSLLLTDGRVLVHSACTANWYFLTPDKKGRYETGSWSKDAASMPSGYAPYLFASQILPDGRVVVNGGEYNTNCSTKAWTTRGALYDPVADSWASVSPPSGWGFIGNAQSTILPNGTYMLADCCDNPGAGALASISGTKVTWTKQATVGCGGGLPCNDNEGWTPLPDGGLLTVDVWQTGANYNEVEVYDTSKGTWSAAAHTAELLSDSTFEIGPAALRPDGTIIQFGANAGGHNDLYTVSSGTWKAGPSFPVVDGVRPTCYHAPAATLPDGNVLVQASPMFAAPSHFFEFSIAKGKMTLTQVNEPAQAPNAASRYGSFLELPTGQVLWANDAFQGSAEVATYTPKGKAKTNWLPVVSSVASTLTVGSTANAIAGTNFNGFSQGASFGSDRQMSTNYPLVRITNSKNGDVCFARSYNFSTMGVWTSGTTNATFDIPKSCKTGASTLQAIVNGLASAGTSVTLSK